MNIKQSYIHHPLNIKDIQKIQQNQIFQREFKVESIFPSFVKM